VPPPRPKMHGGTSDNGGYVHRQAARPDRSAPVLSIVLHEPLRSDVPALLLTGEMDHTTPPAYAERIASALSHSRVVRLPWRSQSDGNPCVMGLIEEILVAGDKALDTLCVAGTKPVSFRLPGAKPAK
jgi:hypothetical protein